MANYESEAKLEDRMIDQLRRQGYNYIEINDVKELEQNFRKRTQITITNLKECVKYLEEKRLSYKVISDNTIDIYEKINVSELVIELSKRNCTVNDYQEKGESLENYYLNLIGGASND